MIKQVIQRADNPIKRVGLIFISISIMFWIGMTLHWNLYHHGFIYHYSYSWHERVSKPQDVKGGQWSETEYGWDLYDTACINKPNGIIYGMPFIAGVKNTDCIIKSVQFEYKTTGEWKQSFGDFIFNLLSMRSSGYFIFNTTASILMAAGLFMFLGIADKMIHWIKSGGPQK